MVGCLYAQCCAKRLRPKLQVPGKKSTSMNITAAWKPGYLVNSILSLSVLLKKQLFLHYEDQPVLP